MSYYRRQNLLIFLISLVMIIFLTPLGMSLSEYGDTLDSYLGNTCSISGIMLCMIGVIGGAILSVISGICFYRDDEFGDV